MEKKVVLVDEHDKEVGVANKTEAHQKGLLHRAFSIFIFNSKGEMLLQQRAFHKYHSGGLWTNACCSHPQPNQAILHAASQRLREELGIDTKLEGLFSFVYKTEFPNGLTEYEYDHVLIGEYDGEILIDTAEINEVCFQKMSELQMSANEHPEKFTTWFRLAFPKVFEWWEQHYGENKE